MDFARQEARAKVSPSRASPPQLPSSPKIRPRARRLSQTEEERGEGGVLISNTPLFSLLWCVWLSSSRTPRLRRWGSSRARRSWWRSSSEGVTASGGSPAAFFAYSTTAPSVLPSLAHGIGAQAAAPLSRNPLRPAAHHATAHFAPPSPQDGLPAPAASEPRP
jgi:hypothetical protein